MRKSFKSFICLMCVCVVFSIIFLPAEALTKIEDDKFVYSLNSDDSLTLYSFKGEDTSLTLPRYALDRRVVGIYSGAFSDSDIEHVIVPDSYAEIGSYAFSNCKNLCEVRLPASLVSLGANAFSGCTGLSSVDFKAAKSLANIPFGTFSGCSNLESVDLPDTITSIGTAAFAKCSALRDVKLPAKLEQIRDNTFIDCSSLASIQLPPTIKGIGNSAFENTSKLSYIEFSSSLTSIGERAFFGDTSLNDMLIPDTVNTIGTDALAPMSYSGSICVTCFEDSYAADYCYNNNVTDLILVKKVSGDCNLDGELNIRDTTLIQKYCAGLSAIDSAAARYLADVNGDGSVTVRDATLIQMWLADIITEF